MAIAFLAGGLLAVGLFAFLNRSVDAGPTSEHDEDVATEFRTRWESWRRAEASYVETTTRTNSESSFSELTTVVQRYPEYRSTDGASVSARLDGRLIGCGPAVSGSAGTCIDAGAYDAETILQSELDDIERFTSGPDRTYDITGDSDDCFDLTHTVDEFRPRWGDSARFCFDESDSVLIEEKQVIDGVTIEVSRTVASTSLTDQDFDLPAEVKPQRTGA